MTPPDPRSDADLLTALAQGDDSAAPALYHRYRDFVYRLAFRFTANAEDAHDVVQEVFLYLVRSAPRITLRAQLTTLLYPAVKHTALAIRRKRRRTSALHPDLDFPAPPLPPDAPEERRQFAQLLERLEENHREVLLMRFVDDLTLEEIATALAIPLGTAKSRLHHALKNLQSNPLLRRHFENP